jgi:predicted nucleic acid-binding protein
MSLGPVVSSSSPLIALERIGRLELIHELLGEVTIPVAVAREVFGAEDPPMWVKVVELGSLGVDVPSSTLGAGEREAIALAIELSARWLVLDDQPARRLAVSRGLSVTGTVGLLLAAKRSQLIDAVAPLLDALDEAGFRLSEAVRHAALHEAGE